MRLLLLVVALSALVPEPSRAWGDRTHPAIVRLAIETLPDDVAPHFRRQLRALERYSNEPDVVLRPRDGRAEAIRHFIDLDGYMPAPFAGFPRTEPKAVAMIGKAKVEKYGVLPWAVLRLQEELRDALAAKSSARSAPDWVRIAGHLAHYIGDGYQPLHLALDFDGQLSGAKGIHRRFENDVADARIDAYEKAVRAGLPRAVPIAALREELFAALFHSYTGHAEIIRADAVARRAGRPDSAAYKRALEAEAGTLVRSQLRDCAAMLGSVWLTSWRAAGR